MKFKIRDLIDPNLKTILVSEPFLPSFQHHVVGEPLRDFWQCSGEEQHGGQEDAVRQSWDDDVERGVVLQWAEQLEGRRILFGEKVRVDEDRKLVHAAPTVKRQDSILDLRGETLSQLQLI